MRFRLPLTAIACFVALSPAPAQSTDSTSRPKPDSTSRPKSDSTGGQKSVLSGVYTDEQATTGDTEHQANCSACHGTENYSGDAFVKNWVGRTAFDLFDQLRTTMPEDNPGGLSPQQYTDIIAYIFKINGLPAGGQVLPADPEALRLIKIEAKPASPGLSAGLLAAPRRVASAGPNRRVQRYYPHAPVSSSARR